MLNLYERLVKKALEGYVVAGAEHEQVEVLVDIRFQQGRFGARAISIIPDVDEDAMSEEELDAFQAGLCDAERDIAGICDDCDYRAYRYICEEYDDSAHPLEGDEDTEDEDWEDEDSEDA